MVTMNCPDEGQVVNVDGVRYRVVRVLGFSGTVARLQVEAL